MPLDEMTRRNLELVESLRGGGTEGTLLLGARSHRDADGRAAAAAVAARAAHRTRGDRRATRRGGALVRAIRSRATRCATRSTTCATSSGWRPRPRRAAARRASCARSATRSSRLPRGRGGAAARRRHGGPARRHARRSGTTRRSSRRDITRDARRAAAARDRRRARRSRTGVDAELDELRALRDGGKDAIARIQADERARTGIASLKVGFNKVFGYYIEVTNVEPAPRAAPTISAGRRSRRASAS